MDRKTTPINLGAVARATMLTMTAGLELDVSEVWEEAGAEIGSAFDALAGLLLDSTQMNYETYRRAVAVATQAVSNVVVLHQDLTLPDGVYPQLVEALGLLQDC